jgi:hypothetical protein
LIDRGLLSIFFFLRGGVGCGFGGGLVGLVCGLLSIFFFGGLLLLLVWWCVWSRWLVVPVRYSVTRLVWLMMDGMAWLLWLLGSITLGWLQWNMKLHNTTPIIDRNSTKETLRRKITESSLSLFSLCANNNGNAQQQQQLR